MKHGAGYAKCSMCGLVTVCRDKHNGRPLCATCAGDLRAYWTTKPPADAR